MKSDCIIWEGSTWSQGRYGMDSVNGKRMGAHRAAWIRNKGAIPKGLYVCHRCDNGLCVNVDHLFLGTPKDNMRDCIDKGRFKYLKKENQKGKHNAHARSDYEYIKTEAKRLRSIGKTYSEIKSILNIKSNGHLRNLITS